MTLSSDSVCAKKIHPVIGNSIAHLSLGSLTFNMPGELNDVSRGIAVNTAFL